MDVNKIIALQCISFSCCCSKILWEKTLSIYCVEIELINSLSSHPHVSSHHFSVTKSTCGLYLLNALWSLLMPFKGMLLCREAPPCLSGVLQMLHFWQVCVEVYLGMDVVSRLRHTWLISSLSRLISACITTPA